MFPGEINLFNTYSEDWKRLIGGIFIFLIILFKKNEKLEAKFCSALALSECGGDGG